MKKVSVFALLVASALTVGVVAFSACGSGTSGSNSGSGSGSEIVSSSDSGSGSGSEIASSSNGSSNNDSSDDDTSGTAEVVSEQVTAEQWASAVGVLNYTCTFSMSYTSNSTYETSGGTGRSTSSQTSQGTQKVAFTADSNGYVSGNSYCSSTEISAYSDSEGNSSNTTESGEFYEIITTTLYKQAVKDTSTSSSTSEWTKKYSRDITGCTMNNTDVGGPSAVYGLGLTEIYSQFTFNGTAYVATLSGEDYNGATYNITLKFKDGYISTVNVEMSYSSSDNTTTATYEYEYTDCGTTTVTIPAEVSALFE
ncbi:MAG: hypothetical protein LUI60_02840 [Clostridia bacterium]|nr:hypothetical protein [Clostridia bacterium]